MAYGDVGGPNLDFSNMCLGFCPEEFTFGDWFLLFATLITTLYIASWIITIARRLMIYGIKTYNSNDEGEGFSDTQKELMKLTNEKGERRLFNIKKELVVLFYCCVLTCLIVAFLIAAF
tara:strand:+ start:122 stop:478 length:357 start_codon:yes stop_codon:yes gene_type:complete